MMSGERVPATRECGNANSPHRFGYFSGGCHSGFGVLGPRKTRHNKIAKKKANTQRRRIDQEIISKELMTLLKGVFDA